MTDRVWTDIGALDQIPRRGARVVRSAQGCVAVFRTADDQAFALEDRCPHKGGPLSQGIVHGKAVTCPLHNWVSELETGEAQGADEGPRARHFRSESKPGAYSSTSRRSPTGRRSEGRRNGRGLRLARPAPIAVSAAACSRAPQATASAEIKGDPEHPGQLRPALLQGLGARRDAVARRPALEADRRRRARPSWDEALDRVAARFSETIAAHGPDSVAFYVSGQLLIEDYYVANKLMKGFIGSANIDTNSRLCMASSVAGHRRAFGSDTVPGVYEDLEEADLVVLVGSNLAWCHPVLFQRLLAAREKRGTKIVAIDPRATATTEAADLHLADRAGRRRGAVLGPARASCATGRIDQRYVETHTVGFEAALAEACAFDLAAAARTTELAPRRAAGLLRPVRRGPSASSPSTARASISPRPAPTRSTPLSIAILRPAASAGRAWGRSRSPASPTPWAGARSAGSPTRSPPIWRSRILSTAGSSRISGARPRLPSKPGLKAVDLFRAVEDGRVKALWIMGTNPADSMPEADRVREAIRKLPVRRRLRRLPLNRHDRARPRAAAERRLGREGRDSHQFRAARYRASGRSSRPPGEALPDWWQMCEVAKRMGFGDAFAYRSPAEIFGEYARLTATENDGRRDLDLGALADISDADYDALTPFQWPRRAGEAPAEARFFADGRFYHADGKARFVATPFRAPAARTSARFPFILNTGRIRDQWHTMTRTAKAPRLMAHVGEPFVEIHPDDARAIGVAAADLVEIESEHGRALLRVVVAQRQRRGSLFAPMHWTDQYASLARVDALASSAVDPVSGQPELKFIAVSANRYAPAWHAFAVSCVAIATAGSDYFAIAPATGGWRAELAGLAAPDDWTAFARKTLTLDDDVEIAAYHDDAGQRRFVAFAGETFAGALFVAREPVAAARSWLAETPW